MSGVSSFEEVVAELAEVRARLVAVEAELAERDALLAERDERIAELERLLEEARRSGKRQAAPFSKGDPAEEPKRPGRKSGKAHGRHGHRETPDRWDRELDVPLPECCPHCGSGDIEEERVADQFQTDLPPVEPTVTRFRVHVGRCRNCQKRLQGRDAEQTSDALGAAGAQVGPHAKALAVWLHYQMGLSFGRCAEVLAQFGIGVTRAAICQASQSTGTDLVPTQRALLDAVAGADMVVMDETGWRICGNGAWLWVATTRDVTVYDVADGRSFADACRLVPKDFDGTIVRDGWVVYPCYEAAVHQTCTAHLLRRCDEMICDNPDWARGAPRQVHQILLEGLAARDRPESERVEIIVDLAEQVELLAQEAHPHEANRRLVGHITREHERGALFRYLGDDTIDATNWRAEQAIRPAVVNRKVWGGNRTHRGATTQARIMSMLRTARQQGADALDLLVDLARAPTPATVPLRYGPADTH